MQYLDEYRDTPVARSLVARIRSTATRRWVVMEMCGGQTHAILRQELGEFVRPVVELIHSSAWPVCVTPTGQIEKAVRLATMPNVIFTALGDLLQAPGNACDLQAIRARSGEVRTVYSPLDALDVAVKHPDREVVFFAVGFETTAPANAMAVWRARQLHVGNFSILVSPVTVPPAMMALFEAPENRVQAFLASGHACSLMGRMGYEAIATRYRVPIVVTGFEPVDILEGLYMAVRQLEEGRHEVEHQYVRSARRAGMPPARDLVTKVFQLVDRTWLGIGELPASGLALRPEFADYDAEARFGLTELHVA